MVNKPEQIRSGLLSLMIYLNLAIDVMFLVLTESTRCYIIAPLLDFKQLIVVLSTGLCSSMSSPSERVGDPACAVLGGLDCFPCFKVFFFGGGLFLMGAVSDESRISNQ